MSSPLSRPDLIDSAFTVIRNLIDAGSRYDRELDNLHLRGIEKRLGFSGVAEEVAALANIYETRDVHRL